MTGQFREHEIIKKNEVDIHEYKDRFKVTYGVPMQLHRDPRHSAGLLSDHLSLDLPNRETAREIKILSIP